MPNVHWRPGAGEGADEVASICVGHFAPGALRRSTRSAFLPLEAAMKDALRAIFSRAAKAVGVVLAIVLLNFLLIRMAPGDPAAVMAGEIGAADAQYMEQLRERFGLDRPLYEQAGIYLAGVVQGDLGYSYRQGTAVSELIVDRLPATLLLTVSAFIFAILAGVWLGVIAAMNVGRLPDFVISIASLLFYATPLFWMGLMSILLFSVHLGWFPAVGMQTIRRRLHRMGACPRCRQASGSAGRDTRAFLHGRLCADDACIDAGSARYGFRPDGQGQGPETAPPPYAGIFCATLSSPSSRLRESRPVNWWAARS